MPAVYIANLYSSNEESTRGRWIDLPTTYAKIQKAIEYVQEGDCIKSSSDKIGARKEYEILKVAGLPWVREDESVYRVNELLRLGLDKSIPLKKINELVSKEGVAKTMQLIENGKMLDVKLTYTEEMTVQDKLWEKERENLDVMERLYNEIVAEAKAKGFTGVVEIYEGPGEMIAEVFETEEHRKLARQGACNDFDVFGYCKPLIEHLESVMNQS